MQTHDRVIFFIGCPLVLMATSALIWSFYKYKKLRKQPGDIVLGIAISDFILALHWLTIAIWPEGVNNTAACENIGSIGTFAGTTEFLYNMAFNLFLLVSLKNALKQDKIPKKSIHFGTIGASIAVLLFLVISGRIGKTFAMTCSILSRCENKTINYAWPPALAASYLALAVYTYIYITKNAPKCEKVNAERTQFLFYYRGYIVATIIIYTFIAVFNVSYVVLTATDNTVASNPSNPLIAALNTIYNITRLGSPLILSAVRFRDPFIWKYLKKILINRNPEQDNFLVKFLRKILIGKKQTDNNSLGISLVVSNESPQQQQHHVGVPVTSIDGNASNPNPDIDSDDDEEGEFNFNKLQGNLKVQITYTLLSCVLYGDKSHRSNMRTSSVVADTHTKKLYKHQKVLQINDEIIKKDLPEVTGELNKNSVAIMQGTLKTYAPDVFARFLDDDSEYLDIHKSLDFVENSGEISDASGPGGGRSGEFFFFSSDKKLIVKTIPDPEMKALVSILDKYDEHFKTHPNSLVAKIYGAFTFASSEYGQNFNLIVMKNLNGLPSTYVRRCYDMKGSTYEREAIKPNEVITSKADLKKYGVMKDLDFVKHEQKLFIKDEFKARIVKQIEDDSTFFKKAGLMDYSFMVFCINKQQYEDENGALNDAFTAKNPLGSLVNTQEPGMIYKIGIVDYLQPYNFQKKFEKVFKKIKKMNANLETSTQDPTYYSNRFITFMTALIDMPK